MNLKRHSRQNTLQPRARGQRLVSIVRRNLFTTHHDDFAAFDQRLRQHRPDTADCKIENGCHIRQSGDDTLIGNDNSRARCRKTEL
jgi:hypothetical protein